MFEKYLKYRFMLPIKLLEMSGFLMKKLLDLHILSNSLQKDLIFQIPLVYSLIFKVDLQMDLYSNFTNVKLYII